MPKDYALDVTPLNEQRRKENAMSDEWVKAFLRRAAIGHVATRWDDQPFTLAPHRQVLGSRRRVFGTTKRSTPSSSTLTSWAARLINLRRNIRVNLNDQIGEKSALVPLQGSNG